MLDTDQLRSFLAIVDTGSFTRAADRVSKTQSAVSMHIRKLEERLGRDLFVKSGRGAKLSADGERLVGFAREMLKLEASAIATVGAKGLVGRVRLGIPDDYTEAYLPGILTHFMRHHPLVEVSVMCESTLALAKLIHERELDLAIVTECAETPGFELIREEQLVWVASPKLKLHAGEAIPLAIGNVTCCWRHAAEAALDGAGIPKRFLLDSCNYSAIGPIVMAGLAVTLLPKNIVRPDHRVLGAADGMPPLPMSRMGLIRSSQSGRAPQVQALEDAIVSSIALEPLAA